MASYRLEAKIVGRSKGQNAVAAAAYRSGESLNYYNAKENTVEVKSYENKENIGHSEIIAPKGCEWAQEREKLWNEAEQKERKSNSQVAREILVSMPVELSPEENRELVKNYVQTQFVEKYGVIADCSFHNETGHNPHCHILLTTRRANENGLQDKAREMNSRDALKGWREEWANAQNREFERLQVNSRVDHRSYKDQGLDKIPGFHVGVSGMQIEEKNPGSSVLVQINADIAELNESQRALKEVEKSIEAATRELAELRKEREKQNIVTPERKAAPTREERQAARIARESERFEKYGLSLGATIVDAKESFYERMSQENTDYAREKRILEQNKIDILKNDFPDKAQSAFQFQSQLDEKVKIDENLRDISIRQRAKLDGIGGMFKGAEKKKLDAEIIDREKAVEQARAKAQENTKNTEAVRTILDMYNRHKADFQQSQEYKHFRHEIEPEQRQRREHERMTEAKQKQINNVLDMMTKDKDKNRGFER